MTNETNSGSKESDKPDIMVRMEKIVAVLDEYESSKGLKAIVVPTEVDKFLNLDEAGLNKLSSEECGNGAYLLDRMAYYIQREINKEHARITWANGTLDSLLVKTLDNYSAFKTEDKMKQAIQDNDVARKVNSIKILAQQRIDRLNYLPSRIAAMAAKLDSLQLSKRRQRYEQ
jgi:hypothetical protein